MELPTIKQANANGNNIIIVSDGTNPEGNNIHFYSGVPIEDYIRQVEHSLKLQEKILELQTRIVNLTIRLQDAQRPELQNRREISKYRL